METTPNPKDPAAAARRSEPLDYAIALSALVGAGFMGYLTYLHLTGASSEVCESITGFSCDLVNQSPFAELLGIPVAVLGGIYFTAVAVLALQGTYKKKYGAIIAFTAFSLVFGAALTALEHLVIGAICLFCELSKLVMIEILALAVLALRRSGEAFDRRQLAAALVVGALFAGGHYLLQREPPVQYDYSGVAQCLTENGVAMYGSFTCPKCKKQARSFGDAYPFVDYVECHPQGPDAEPERCVALDIVRTPTWVQIRDGVEERRFEGAHPPEKIGEFFGCPF
jgi:uncharacterized membrane protein